MKVKFAIGCAVAALMQAPHAFATTATVTYFGVVDNTQTFYFNDETVVEPAPDYDVAKLFGGGNLEGDLVTATFTYNTSVGIDTLTPGVSEELDGGSSYKTASPLISATFSIQQPTTLDVYSYTFKPNYYADVYTSASYIDEEGYSKAGDAIDAYLEPASGGPTNLSYSYTGDGYGPDSYFDPVRTKTGQQDVIPFDTIAVTVVSSAPEPSTWALLMTGIGAIGIGLRHRRSRKGEGAAAAV